MLSAYWPWWGDATDRQRDRHGCYMKSSLSSSSSLTRRRRSGLSSAWNRTPDGRWRERAVRARAGVTLKYLPHEKSARGEWVNHGIDSLPLLKNRHRPPKSLLGHYRIASPQEQSPPTDNLLAKTRPLFLPVNCRPGSLFWGEPIMGHLPAVPWWQTSPLTRLCHRLTALPRAVSTQPADQPSDDDYDVDDPPTVSQITPTQIDHVHAVMAMLLLNFEYDHRRMQSLAIQRRASTSTAAYS